MATKRFKPSKNKDTQPPSKQWLARETRRKMWEDLKKFNGSTTGSPQLDAQLQTEFGRFKNDPTVGSFRLKDGKTIESDDSEGADFTF